MLTYNQNGTSRGIASIIFGKADTAAKAAKELNGLLVDGRPMKVSIIIFHKTWFSASDSQNRSRSFSMPLTLLPSLPPSRLPSVSPRSLSRSPPLRPRQPTRTLLPERVPVARVLVAARAATLAVASPRLSKNSTPRWWTISPTRTPPLRAMLPTVTLSRPQTAARTSAWPRFP